MWNLSVQTEIENACLSGVGFVGKILACHLQKQWGIQLQQQG